MTKTYNDIDLDKFNLVDFSPELLNDFLITDGALRDIYVDNTSIKDWENVIERLKNSDFSIKYFVDNNESKLPADISSLFTNSQNALKLELKKENIIINSFILIEDQIEFDIDPRDFVAEEQHSIIFEFLNLLVAATNKTIKLCDENSADTPYLILLPNDKKVYVAKSGF